MTCGAHTHHTITSHLFRIPFENPQSKMASCKFNAFYSAHLAPNQVQYYYCDAFHCFCSAEKSISCGKSSTDMEKNSGNQLSHHQHRWSNENSSMQIRLLFRFQFYSLSQSQCVRFKFHFEPFLARIFIPFTLFTEINKNANTLQDANFACFSWFALFSYRPISAGMNSLAVDTELITRIEIKSLPLLIRSDRTLS